MEEAQTTPLPAQLAQPGWRELLKKLGISLAFAAMLGGYLSLPGTGFAVLFLIFFQLFFIPLRMFYGITIPNERRVHFGRVAIWLLTIALVFLVHHVREDIRRKYADEVVAQLDAYTAAHGKCATRLEDVGLSSRDFHDRMGYGGYFCDGGKPFLFYMASFDGFSRWYFDFEKHEWDYFSD